MRYYLLGILIVLTFQGCNEIQGEHQRIALPLKREANSFVLDIAFYNRLDSNASLMFQYQLRIGLDTLRVNNSIVELPANIEITKRSMCKGEIANTTTLNPKTSTGKGTVEYRLEGLVMLHLLSHKSVILNHSENKRIQYNYPVTDKSINNNTLFYTEIIRQNGNNIPLIFDIEAGYDSTHKVSGIKIISKADDYLHVGKNVFYLGEMEGLFKNETAIYLKQL